MYKTLTEYWKSVKKCFKSDFEHLCKNYSLERFFLCMSNIILYCAFFSLITRHIKGYFSFVNSDIIFVSILIFLYEIIISFFSNIGLTVIGKFHIKEILHFETSPLYKIYFIFLAIISSVLIIIKIPSIFLFVKNLTHEKSR